MTYQEALDFIPSMHRLGKKAGLSKITQLMEYLGNPQKQLKFVHVAGTNGKGSTTTMTAHALTQAGYKTGLFISPYILNFRERMQIDGQLIPEEELVACVQQVKPFVEQMAAQGNCPAEFEVDTALALCWFAQQHCDIVVLEVGLGGRFDATNVIDVPEAAGVAITEEGVLAGQPVMIRPMDGNTVTLDIKTDNALYEGVTATIDGDASFLPGKAYTITLNFIQEEVELTATVTEWDNTGKGSGTIL